MRIGFCNVIACATAWLSSASAALAGPAVATELKATTLSFEACLERGAALMREAGFGRIERAGKSVFGTRGDYTGSIRCATDKGLVFFVVAGPSRSEVGKANDYLSDHF